MRYVYMCVCVRVCMHTILCGSGVHVMEVRVVSLMSWHMIGVLWCDLHFVVIPAVCVWWLL